MADILGMEQPMVTSNTPFYLVSLIPAFSGVLDDNILRIRYHIELAIL